MILLPALLALSSVQAAPAPPAPNVSASNMIVTGEQLAAALSICRDQLAKPRFAGTELLAAGWPKVISVAPNDKSPAMTTYRHPENMLLLTLVDHQDKADQCVIMVPFGPEIDVAKVIARISSIAERGPDRPGGWPTWKTAAFDLQFDPMATSGVRITFTKKGS